MKNPTDADDHQLEEFAMNPVLNNNRIFLVFRYYVNYKIFFAIPLVNTQVQLRSEI